MISSIFGVLLGVLSLSAQPTSQAPDLYDDLISSYGEVLLIGHACEPFGISLHQSIYQRTIKDLVALGVEASEARTMVEDLIRDNGTATAAIITDESDKNQYAAIFYCSTAYDEKLNSLNMLRKKVGLED